MNENPYPSFETEEPAAQAPPASPTFLQLAKATADTDHILGLMVRLGRHNSVRLLALAQLQRDPLPTIQPLLKTLARRSGDRWRERQLAAWLLGRASLKEQERADAIKVLIKVVQRETGPDQGRLRRALLRVLMVAVTAGIIAKLGDNQALWLLSFCVCAATPTLTLSMDDLHEEETRIEAMRALIQMRAVEAIGAFAFATQARNSKNERRVALSGVRDVLPLLTPEHYGRLDTQAVPALCHLLRSDEEGIVLDVLEALGKVGDGRCFDDVDALVAKGRTQEIRRAALQLLPILRERKKKEAESGMLLRGASRPTGSGQLLRAAEDYAVGANTSYRQSELLRATMNNDPAG